MTREYGNNLKYNPDVSKMWRLVCSLSVEETEIILLMRQRFSHKELSLIIGQDESYIRVLIGRSLSHLYTKLYGKDIKELQTFVSMLNEYEYYEILEKNNVGECNDCKQFIELMKQIFSLPEEALTELKKQESTGICTSKIRAEQYTKKKQVKPLIFFYISSALAASIMFFLVFHLYRHFIPHKLFYAELHDKNKTNLVSETIPSPQENFYSGSDVTAEQFPILQETQKIIGQSIAGADKQDAQNNPTEINSGEKQAQAATDADILVSVINGDKAESLDEEKITNFFDISHGSDNEKKNEVSTRTVLTSYENTERYLPDIELGFQIKEQFIPETVASIDERQGVYYKKVVNEYGKTEFRFDPENKIKQPILELSNHVALFLEDTIAFISHPDVQGEILGIGDIPSIYIIAKIPIKTFDSFKQKAQEYGEAGEIFGPEDASTADIKVYDKNSDGFILLKIDLNITK